MERLVECPSGFAGRVKHLSARDADILADDRAMRSGKAADVILKKCWLETNELGPYTFERDAVDWSSVLACDRTYALLMVRVATYGESEDLDLRCPVCSHKFVWDMPLLELPVRPLPEHVVEQISQGRNRFETELDGRKVYYRVMDGRDQLRAIQFIRNRNDDIVVAALKSRVVEVDGVERSRLNEYLGDLSMGDIQTIIDAMDENDGGIETEFDVYCPSCSNEWEVEIPLDLGRMFSPRKPSARRRRRKTSRVKA